MGCSNLCSKFFSSEIFLRLLRLLSFYAMLIIDSNIYKNLQIDLDPVLCCRNVYSGNSYCNGVQKSYFCFLKVRVAETFLSTIVTVITSVSPVTFRTVLIGPHGLPVVIIMSTPSSTHTSLSTSRPSKSKLQSCYHIPLYFPFFRVQYFVHL